MKHSKWLSIVLAAVLVFAFSAAAFAAGTGEITVNNPKADQAYTAYKIFDVVYDSEKTTYSYTIPADSPWYGTVAAYAKTVNSGLTLTGASGKDVYVVTFADAFSAPNFAKALKTALQGDLKDIVTDGVVLGKENDAATVVKATGLDLGYYFVTSTNGALCNLTTTNPTVTIYDKNDMPFNKVDDKNSVDVGMVVNYTVTGKVPDTTGFSSYTYKITDKMSDGLTFNQASFSVTVGGAALATNNYTVDFNKSENGGFDYVLTIKVKELQNLVGQEIKVTYTATVNENAVADIENNTATLTYSNDPADASGTNTIKKEETVYSAKIVIDKYKANSDETKLSGAKFVLYKKVVTGEGDDQTTKELFYKWNDTDKKVEWVEGIANATVKMTDNNGACSFDGVADDTYYIRETEAPAGYNLLTTDVEVVINGASATKADLTSLTVTKEVANGTGEQLPSTGGMGTKMFYAFGSILVLGALVLLVVRRRMRTEK